MTSPKPNTFALIAAAGVCVVGMVVLLGWAFDVAAIKSLGPGWPKMVPLTALVFVLAGLSLWGEASAGGPALKIAHVGALLVVAAGTLRLAEDLLGIPHAFDMLGFRETSPPGGSPSRMAPTAACSFQLIGCALLLARRAQFALHFHVLAFIAGLNGVLGLFRYLAGGEAWLPLRFMAVHTSASFVLLAAGVVCLRPHGGLIELLLADRRHGILSKPAAYGLAVVLTGFTLLVRVTIGNAPENPTLIIFTIPIILSAYWGGLGPGLLATFLAGIGADYFVLTPRYGLGLSSTTERWQVAVLFLSGGLICFICMRLQRARERTEAMVAELQRESAKRQEADERAHWLASFPERSPNPIAEFDPRSGTLLYANPAASALLPGLAGDGLNHLGLDRVREIVHGWNGAHPEVARCEASLASACFLLTVTCDPQTRRARIYGSDITERKRAEEIGRASCRERVSPRV